MKQYLQKQKYSRLQSEFIDQNFIDSQNYPMNKQLLYIVNQGLEGE